MALPLAWLITTAHKGFSCNLHLLLTKNAEILQSWVAAYLTSTTCTFDLEMRRGAEYLTCLSPLVCHRFSHACCPEFWGGKIQLGSDNWNDCNTGKMHISCCPIATEVRSFVNIHMLKLSTAFVLKSCNWYIFSGICHLKHQRQRSAEVPKLYSKRKSHLNPSVLLPNRGLFAPGIGKQRYKSE